MVLSWKTEDFDDHGYSVTVSSQFNAFSTPVNPMQFRNTLICCSQSYCGREVAASKVKKLFYFFIVRNGHTIKLAGDLGVYCSLSHKSWTFLRKDKDGQVIWTTECESFQYKLLQLEVYIWKENFKRFASGCVRVKGEAVESIRIRWSVRQECITNGSLAVQSFMDEIAREIIARFGNEHRYNTEYYSGCKWYCFASRVKRINKKLADKFNIACKSRMLG